MIYRFNDDNMIIAKCIDDKNPRTDEKYPIEIGESYEVELISMGQSWTFIYLKDFEQQPFNSLVFEFYEDDKPLDIYKDKRFNPYI